MKNQKVQTQRRPQVRPALKKRAIRKSGGVIRRAGKVSDVLGRAPEATFTTRSVPARWRWHYRVLWSLQNRLLRERVELRQAAAEPLEPHSLDEADSATDEFDHDLALTQLSTEQDALSEVSEALKRIRNGSYGVCQETGEAIPAPRLRAIPWTRFTREVEDRLEKKGVVSRTRVNKAATVRGKGRIWLAPEEEAEETEEAPPAPPNDEKLQVESAPGGRVSPQKRARPQRRKGRGT